MLYSSSVGKLYARCLRVATVPAHVAEWAGAQFGAVPKGGTDPPAVSTQGFFDGDARRGRTVAVLFADIKGAFYNVFPEIALGPLLATPQRFELLGKLGMSEAAAQALSDSIESGVNALSRHGLAEGWRSPLADWHRGSWFMVRGSDRCTMPPGRSAAKGPGGGRGLRRQIHVFLKLLNAELEARGLQPSLEVAGAGIFRAPGASPKVIAIPEMTYVDDVAVPIEAPHAGQIFDMLVDAADDLLQVAKAFGLKVNIAAGKTEAVVRLHSRGLAEARQRLTSPEDGQEDGSKVPVPRIPGESACASWMPTSTRAGILRPLAVWLRRSCTNVAVPPRPPPPSCGGSLPPAASRRLTGPTLH